MITTEEINKVKHAEITVEEHRIVVQKPDSEYIGHFTPATGPVADITSIIFTLPKTKKLKRRYCSYRL